jgi:hypothetical protein
LLLLSFKTLQDPEARKTLWPAATTVMLLLSFKTLQDPEAHKTLLPVASLSEPL